MNQKQTINYFCDALEISKKSLLCRSSFYINGRNKKFKINGSLDISFLKCLEKVVLCNLGITEIYVGKIDNLKSLTLTYNPLEYFKAEHDCINYLKLSNNKLNKLDIKGLKGLKGLKTLDISCNLLRNDIILNHEIAHLFCNNNYIDWINFKKYKNLNLVGCDKMIYKPEEKYNIQFCNEKKIDYEIV